jgi:FixJ family two-component response regulator
MCKQVVHVVDSDAWTRQTVQRLLVPGGCEVRAFASATRFLAAYDGEEAGCVVLDLQLRGFEVLARLSAMLSPLVVVFLSRTHDVGTVVAATKSGAFDFLVKPIDPTALVTAVSAALRESATRWAGCQAQIKLWERFNTLTPRERQVCRLVASGYLNKQAAYELGTAEKTVKVHRARVMAKLQVGSVAELVRFVDHLTAAPRVGAPALVAPQRAAVGY